jgi:D-alanyl-D-alanine carboxypeptidase
MVVEHATGISLAQQVYWRILQPLGMDNTYFDPDETMAGPVVRGYVGTRDYTDMNMSFAWGAGGMVSTAEDLGRFARALFGGELLQPQTLATMLTFDSGHGGLGASNFSYGLGVMQDMMSIGPALNGQPRPDGQAVVQGHTGGLTGYRSTMWYLPASGSVVVVGLNQMYYDPNIIVTATMDTLLAYHEQMNQAVPVP